jgi:hypothetical protein
MTGVDLEPHPTTGLLRSCRSGRQDRAWLERDEQRAFPSSGMDDADSDRNVDI